MDGLDDAVKWVLFGCSASTSALHPPAENDDQPEAPPVDTSGFKLNGLKSEEEPVTYVYAAFETPDLTPEATEKQSIAEEALRPLVEEGLKVGEIAERLNVIKRDVTARVEELGLTSLWNERRQKRTRSQRPKFWTPERQEELIERCRQGRTEKEMAAAFETSCGAITGQIDRLRLRPMWRDGRLARSRRERAAMAEALRAGSAVPSETSTVGIGLQRRKRSSAPLPPKEERERMIEEFVRKNGVSIAPDFGADTPAVDYLKACGIQVARLSFDGGGYVWVLNGQRLAQDKMWARVNELRKRAHLPALVRATE